MELQAKPAYWGIVDPTQLPGYGLKFSLTGNTGTGNTGNDNARVITLTATNGEAGPAYSTQISSLTLRQIFGRPCSVVVTPPSAFPVVLGDIAAGGTASSTFTINFAGCDRFAAFALIAPWSSATYHTGTFVTGLEDYLPSR